MAGTGVVVIAIPPHPGEQTVSARKLAADSDPGHELADANAASGEMTPFAWLIGFVLPACAATGAQGLPTPALMDLSHIERPASPNTGLAAPEGTQPKPDIATPVYAISAAGLYAAVLQVAAGQPRTFVAAAFPAERQVHFVARSAMLNFPDLVAAQVNEAGPGRSTLVLYSRSVYGYGDLGVNRQRLATWLTALQATLSTPANHPDER
jgi:uncharacterized protein (DUF1499 family)